MRHMQLTKRILRYTAGIVHHFLKYFSSVDMPPWSLDAHVDTDWGGCNETRKSTSGWTISVNKSPIVWRTKKQTIVAVSSAESEYIAMDKCVKQVSWIRKMFWEMTHRQPWSEDIVMYAPTIINIDSSAALALAMNKQACTWT